MSSILQLYPNHQHQVQFGDKRGEEEIEKEREREGSIISAVPACNCSNYVNRPLLKATIPHSPPLHHPTLILPNSSCVCSGIKTFRTKHRPDTCCARFLIPPAPPPLQPAMQKAPICQSDSNPSSKFSQMVFAKWWASFGSLLCKEINWKERMKRPRWMVTQWEDCCDPSAAMRFTSILSALKNHHLPFPKITAPFNRRKPWENHKKKRRNCFIRGRLIFTLVLVALGINKFYDIT